MLKKFHLKKTPQLIVGLVIGILFGFLLQKGGVTDYDVIIGQLLLSDFTVVKIMLCAVITGMLGAHALSALELVQIHPKAGSFGSSVIGGLIFGVGFGILGYCPGTIAGAVGQGFLDALLGGVPGIIVGSGIFAAIYPKLEKSILKMGDFGELALPQLFKANLWTTIILFASFLISLLFWMEKAGL